MKLIREQCSDVEYIKEEGEKGKEKSYYISGVFLQANTKNKNGRIYPIKIIEREVENYNKNYIQQNRALSELGHPDTPNVNPERVSHLIKELKMDGLNVMGKAKLLDTPFGRIAKTLVDEGVKLGVSSRGLGSLKENSQGIKEVQDDFQLNAIDIVADPSAPDAFVEGLMEGVEWIYENGIIKPMELDEYRKQIRQAKKSEIESKSLELFHKFMRKISK